MKIHAKPRKDPSNKGIFTIDGKEWVIGTDLLRNTEIQDAKARTRERACFRECRSCGQCAASSRDATDPRTYDANAGKMIDCRGCEPFRFHDCHNGWIRDSYGDAEHFTEEARKLFAEGGKPLI